MNGLFRPEWSTLKKLMFLQAANGGSAWDTISGNPVSFSAKAAPLRKLQVAFSPVQSGSGDPSPDNARPISGWSSLTVEQRGVNVWDEEWEVGGYLTTDGSKYANPNCVRNKNPISVKPNTQYYKGTASPLPANVFYLAYYDANMGFISVDVSGAYNTTFTTPANAAFLNFWRGAGSYPVTDNSTKAFINYPSTDHEYHAYNPSSRSISISLGSTVYSGTLDVVTGVVTVDRVGITLTKDSAWYNFAVGTGNAVAFFLLPYTPKVGATAGTYNGAISSTGIEYPKYWGSGRPNESVQDDLCFGITANNVTFHRKDVSAFQTFEAWKAGFPDTTLVYTLAEPLTIQLTPQQVSSLLGDNVLFSDANGDLTVEYRSN